MIHWLNPTCLSIVHIWIRHFCLENPWKSQPFFNPETPPCVAMWAMWAMVIFRADGQQVEWNRVASFQSVNALSMNLNYVNLWKCTFHQFLGYCMFGGFSHFLWKKSVFLQSLQRHFWSTGELVRPAILHGSQPITGGADSRKFHPFRGPCAGPSKLLRWSSCFPGNMRRGNKVDTRQI